jgi:hypothetical protein
MPKKPSISLQGIVTQIDQATKQLSTAKKKATKALDKRKLAAKIKNLQRMKKKVRSHCHGLNITVPTA